MRMSPLNKLVFQASSSKAALVKRTSAKKQKTMTINRSRVSGIEMVGSDPGVHRSTVKSMSPESQSNLRPRRIKMPTVMNPDCVFFAKNSKNLV